MEIQNNPHEEMWQKMEKQHRRGKIVSGILIIVIGSLFLARELGVEIPAWVLSWKMLLVGIGLMIGFKHRFRNFGWLVPVMIGGAFLMCDIYPEMQLKPVLWPVLLIFVGLIMVFKPRNKRCRDERYMRRHWRQKMRHGMGHAERHAFASEYYSKQESTNDDVIDSICFMSGVKKNILSKNFKGGEVGNFFGGTELNLMQADFEGTTKLEITQVFGGTKLLIPAHWEIKSELVTVFGSTEDKRPLPPLNTEEKTKTLILTGTTFFGGIEIRSY